MHIMCAIPYLVSTLRRRVGALQISIISSNIIVTVVDWERTELDPGKS